MDRNEFTAGIAYNLRVALLTESVDRNSGLAKEIGVPAVALLTESVDRNRVDFDSLGLTACRSPHGERG